MTFAHLVAPKRAIFSDLKSSKVNALELVAALSNCGPTWVDLGAEVSPSLQGEAVPLAVYRLRPASFGTVLHDFVGHDEGRRRLSWSGVMR